MASQGPNLPGAASQSNVGQSGRLAFDDPSRILAADSIVCTSAVSTSTSRPTNKLIASNFGFTIPAGQIIVGVEFTFSVRDNISINGHCIDGTAELLYNGVVVGQIVGSGSNWTAFLATRTVGDPTNLWGWPDPTPEKINDASFSVQFEAHVPSGNSASIDWFKLKVYYTPLTYAANEGTGGVGVGGGTSGGTSSLYKHGRIGTGGVGVGGLVGFKVKPLGTGGFGAGGAGNFRRIRTVVGTGGAGIGGTYTLQKYFLGGNGGMGVGGHGDSRQGIIQVATGGMGVGGDGNRRMAPLVTGGFGAGGTADFYRRRPIAGTGGVGVGGGGDPFSRRRFAVGDGGFGAGGAGTSAITQKYAGRGGLGVGGAIGIHRLVKGLSDPEDDIERSHRGPVTRRMVFEAIRRALVDGPLNKYNVYLADDEPDMNNAPSGQKLAVIIPSTAANDQGDLTGGGDVGTMRTDGVQVRVYSESSIDAYPKSTAWNLKIDTGAMERARKIRRTLNLLDLMDDAGWALLTEPMRATTTGNATFRRANPQWGYYAEHFEVVYTEYLG